MYTVLLVDDEKWITEGLKRYDVWEKNGFRIVGTADNGKTALELIELLRPDVVFTDLKMPHPDGLELMAKTEDSADRPLFIVASGYAEFAYAKKAMSFGAIGYCVKPFEPEEIEKDLIRAADILEERCGENTYRLLDYIWESTEESLAKAGGLLKKQGISLENGKKIQILFVYGGGKVVLGKNYPSVTVSFGFQKKLSVIGLEQPQKEIIIGSLQGPIVGVGMSSVISNLQALRKGIEQALLMGYQFFIDKSQTVHRYDSMIYRKPEFREYDSCLKNASGIGRLHIIDELRAVWAEGGYTVKDCYNLYNSMIRYLSGRGLMEFQFLDDYEQLTELFSDLNEMFDYLKEILTEEEDVVPVTNNSTVLEIISYTDQNYFKNITLKDISGRFHLNQNYLCQLFKKETGVTFTQYITELRIREACRGLERSEEPIGELARRIGYDNYFYFSRVFKKVMGMAPGEYRKIKFNK